MSGNQLDVASSEAGRTKMFKLLVLQGNALSSAYRQAFPTTVHELERKFKEPKRAAHSISARASRLAKKLSITISKKDENGDEKKVDVTLEQVSGGAMGVYVEGYKAASLSELTKFMEEMSEPVSTEAGQIAMLHNWLGLFEYRAKLAAINENDKDMVGFINEAQKILVLLDPQRYKRGEKEGEDISHQVFFDEIKLHMKKNRAPYVKVSQDAG